MAAEPIATFERTHPVTGRKQRREAYTPTEVVNFTADGWVEQTAAKPAESDKSSAAAAKPAGK